ncbi:hypothetical protein Ddye_023121 [Dipteronia dyeriana]|uniref:Reverse transcriptase zinc-binding domain-containing protein n=1 Tax=Dipteronia dyeriana TaxID=168575 RepID=A0AAD9WSY2_9ROSI|nr:hypothetical protein Ddye_023121 [Dipteronia dyeriana]
MCSPKSEGGLGFRDLETSNRAILAKQCWRFLKTPKSLAVKVLKGCYFKDGNFIDAKSNSAASFVWRSLVWGKELLKTGIHWLLVMVSQIITPSCGWNLQVLRENFIPSDVEAITQIPICNGDRKYTIMWHYNDKGVYTVKSGYWIGRKLVSNPSSSNTSLLASWWNFLWKLYIPLKVKIFVWKPCHNWIPTKFNISKRGVHMSGICEACKICDETTIHALWDCNKLKSVRKYWSSLSGKHIGSYSNFFELMMDRASLYNRKDAGLFCVMAWSFGDSNDEVFASSAQTILANLNEKTAKLSTMLNCIRFSVECGLTPCVFEMDEALVVKWIIEDQCNFFENGALIDDIRFLSSDMRKVKFVHNSKKANGVARSLAKLVLDVAVDTFWMEEVPACLNALVLADKPG